MLIALARIYVYTLAAMMSLLLSFLLIIQIAVAFGKDFPIGGRLFLLFFAINVPSLGLAVDRNIWKNEVKSCPRWMKIALLVLFIFSIVMGLVGVAFEPPIAPSNWDAAITSFMLVFSAGSACVLYATIKTARSNETDLLARTKRSLVGTAVAAVFAVFSLFAPHNASTT